MTATVTIENGFAKIILKAENDFEKTLIENGKTLPRRDIEFTHESEYGYNSKKNHKIVISLREALPEEPVVFTNKIQQ